jgi:hypothetical protein
VKPLPADIASRQARRIAAFCDDLFDLASGKHTGPSDTPRTDALIAIERISRAEVRP